jgi:hypothetical protein
MPSVARQGRARGRVLLAAAVLLGAMALASPAPASATLLKGFWGIRQDANGKSSFPVYKDLGVNVVQIQLRWNDAAPIPPINPRDPKSAGYQWPSDVTSAVSQAKKYHMRVAIMIIYSPSWASGSTNPASPPTSPKSLADFAYAASRKYSYAHLWMIWGETNANLQWTPQGGAPQYYSQVLDAAYGQLKKRDKHNLVIGGNTFTAGDTKPFDWVRQMRLPNGKPPRMDLFGHNPFANRKPDLRNPQERPNYADFSDLKRFGKTVDKSLGTKSHRHIQLFLSEWCEPTAPGDSEFAWWLTYKQQADWLKAGFKIAKSIGAYMLGWIHLDDVVTPSGYTSYSGLRDRSGHKKPAYSVFRHGG